MRDLKISGGLGVGDYRSILDSILTAKAVIYILYYMSLYECALKDATDFLIDDFFIFIFALKFKLFLYMQKKLSVSL